MPVTSKTIPDGSNQLLPKNLRLEAAGTSHVGQVRESNEDVLGIFPDMKLFVVADGMGGRAAGEIAARMAVDALEAFFRENRNSYPKAWPFPSEPRLSRAENLLRVGLMVANRQILDAARGNSAWYRMGATIAAITFDDDHLAVAHAGDVRVYRLRQGKLSRLTRDHSVIEEMRTARPGLAPQEIAAIVNRNVITRALGSKNDFEPTVCLTNCAEGDIFLIASDGVWGCVPDDKLNRIVEAHTDLEPACHVLIEAANVAGAPDNATALLVRVGR